jgi:hypothetical protein
MKTNPKQEAKRTTRASPLRGHHLSEALERENQIYQEIDGEILKNMKYPPELFDAETEGAQ